MKTIKGTDTGTAVLLVVRGDRGNSVMMMS